MITKEASNYRERLRQIALDYYHRRIGFIEFRQRMIAAIGSGFAQAWLDGRSSVGVTRGLRFPERMILYREVQGEIGYLDRLTSAIDDLVNGGKDISVISRRLDLWGEAYDRVSSLSQIYNGENKRLKWTLHPAEHCPDCIILSGSVHTAAEWIRYGLHPKSWRLECKQGCKCSLDPTDEPIGGPIW